MKVIRTIVNGRTRTGPNMFTNDAYELFEWLDKHVGPRDVAWNAYQHPTDNHMCIILKDESNATMVKLRWS